MITLILFFFSELSSAWKYSFLFMQGALYSMGAAENLEKTPASCQPLVGNRCNLHYNTCIMTLKRDRTCLAGCASRITSKIPFLTLRDGSGFVPTHCLVNWIQRRSSSSVHIPAMCSSTELSSGWADNPRILALWGGRWGSNSTTYCVTCAQRLADPTGKSLQEWLGKNPIYPPFFFFFLRGWWWTVHCSNRR